MFNLPHCLQHGANKVWKSCSQYRLSSYYKHETVLLALNSTIWSVSHIHACYLTVDYDVCRMVRAHFSHFSLTTEMDESKIK